MELLFAQTKVQKFKISVENFQFHSSSIQSYGNSANQNALFFLYERPKTGNLNFMPHKAKIRLNFMSSCFHVALISCLKVGFIPITFIPLEFQSSRIKFSYHPSITQTKEDIDNQGVNMITRCGQQTLIHVKIGY